MNTPTRSTGHRRFAAWAAGLLAVLTGCHAIDFYTPSLQAPVPAELQPPRELSKVSLPTYRIEAPDIVRLDVMRLIPRPSYRIDAYDVLQIRGYGVLLQQPIDDYFLVEAGGIVTLGPAYGVVRVEGMTTEEASAAITQMLRTFLPYAQATVRLARSANAQDISREYIVGPDGVINISRFGAVRLIGLTVTEARLAIQERLAPYFDRPVVGVEVVGFNSKFYYVITAEAALLGESVLRFPVTGNETVLDAIGQLSQTPGMHKVSSKTMWVARPVPDSCNEEQILPSTGTPSSAAARRQPTTNSCRAIGSTSSTTIWWR